MLKSSMSGGCARILVDGLVYEVMSGRTLAAALVALGIRHLRNSPRAKAPRGAFCMMGACQECLVRIDGQVRAACMVAVTPGMSVTLDRDG